MVGRNVWNDACVSIGPEISGGLNKWNVSTNWPAREYLLYFDIWTESIIIIMILLEMFLQ